MEANLELHIDKLVLHGFERKDGPSIGEALKKELTRLVQLKGVPPNFYKTSEYKKLNTNSLTYRKGARPEQIGKELALLIYNSFSA